MHRVSSKRSWRKMHLGTSAAVMTDKNIMDDAAVDALCEQIDLTCPLGRYPRIKPTTKIMPIRRWDSTSLRLISSSKDNLFYDEDKKHAKRCRAMLEIAAKGQMGGRQITTMGSERWPSWRCSGASVHLATHFMPENSPTKRWR